MVWWVVCAYWRIQLKTGIVIGQWLRYAITETTFGTLRGGTAVHLKCRNVSPPVRSATRNCFCPVFDYPTTDFARWRRTNFDHGFRRPPPRRSIRHDSRPKYGKCLTDVSRTPCDNRDFGLLSISALRSNFDASFGRCLSRHILYVTAVERTRVQDIEWDNGFRNILLDLGERWARRML